MVGLLCNMNKKVGLILGVGFLKVAKRLDALEAHLRHKVAYIALAERKHVQVVHGTIRKRVFKPRQAVVYIFRFGGHLVATIVILVFTVKAHIKNGRDNGKPE